ncbi:hypothetical protein M8828_01375 [Aeromonas simiae]|uniref:hypothetical protein n=1 Tax=Aeromonas simiae TaxID=218936 RepID=UPI00266D44E9|nr:hypothetical protein [Aeromonas simiae]MDO2946932.1 hypothetical protein [Aeromonas simiae]MDO2954474.1 hypothetical protein [Aeromonas simiae]
MKIKLSPNNNASKLTAVVSGDVITLNDIALDFSPLGEGDVLPASAINSPWIASDVTRVGGEISLTLCLPHGANAPHETRFPAAFDVPITVMAGPVPLPPYETEPEVMA